jgi:hypothetical protein
LSTPDAERFLARLCRDTGAGRGCTRHGGETNTSAQEALAEAISLSLVTEAVDPGGGWAQLAKKAAKAASKAAATFAPRASGNTGKNPAVKGSVLYQVFEVQVCESVEPLHALSADAPAYAAIREKVNWWPLTLPVSLSRAQAYLAVVVGGLLAYNVIWPSDEPSIARLMGMWSLWCALPSPTISAGFAPTLRHQKHCFASHLPNLTLPVTVRIHSTSHLFAVCTIAPPSAASFVLHVGTMTLAAAEGAVALGAWVGLAAHSATCRRR